MATLNKTTIAIAFSGLLAVGSACSSDSGKTPDCVGDNCDDPNGVANAVCQKEAARICQEELGKAGASIGASLKQCADDAFKACRDEVAFTAHCDVRRDDALGCSSTSVAHSFVPGALRWAAQDVNCVSSGSDINLISCKEPTLGVGGDTGADERGRTRDEINDGRFDNESGFAPATQVSTVDDRGQEYTEYFAVVQMPPVDGTQSEPRIIGRVNGDPNHNIDFTEDQLEEIAFDHDGDGVFGSCVFSSWHTDNNRPLEIGGNLPAPGQDVRAEWINTEYGLEMNAQNLRMRIGINGNNAAADLVDNCGSALAGLSSSEGARLSPGARLSVNHEDTFERGCMRTYELFTTEWRRSDPTICTVPMRMEECGCGLKIDVDDESLTVPVGAGVDAGERTWTVLSKLLVPDPDGANQAGVFSQLASVADGAGKPKVASALEGLATQGAGAGRFYMRGFVYGSWDDVNTGTALIGENLSGAAYQIDEAKCTSLGGTPTVEGACEVATWGTKFTTEALSAPEGCKYIQIAKKGCLFAAEGEDCSEANGGMGEHGRNVLSCDITFNKMTQVLGTAGLNPEDGFKDMKSFCQAAYGDLTVVHIPYQAAHIPSASIVCEPPAGMEAACGFATENPATMVETNASGGNVCAGGDEVITRGLLPDAVLDRSNEETEESRRRTECSVVCSKGQACGDRCIAAEAVCDEPAGSACQGNASDLSAR